MHGPTDFINRDQSSSMRERWLAARRYMSTGELALFIAVFAIYPILYLLSGRFIAPLRVPRR
jgi:hypothetical protein